MKIEIIPATDIIGGAVRAPDAGRLRPPDDLLPRPAESGATLRRGGHPPAAHGRPRRRQGLGAPQPRRAGTRGDAEPRSKCSTAAASKAAGHCAASSAPGASRAICGSIAVREPESFRRMARRIRRREADPRAPTSATARWPYRDGRSDPTMTAQELIARFAPQGLAQVICTDIARDGMLCGTSAEFYAGLQGQLPRRWKSP